MLARWTGRIAPNSESDHISAFWDVFPTFCEIAGILIQTVWMEYPSLRLCYGPGRNVCMTIFSGAFMNEVAE